MKGILLLLLIMSLVLTFAGGGLLSRPQEAEMTVYISDELSVDEARMVGTKLQQLPEVMQCTFVSAEQAWEDFVEDQEDPEAFAGVEADMLRHRYVLAVNTDDLEELAETIRKIEGVDEVKIDRLPLG